MPKEKKPYITNAKIKDAETIHIGWLNGASDDRWTPEENEKFQIAADQGKLKWLVSTSEDGKPTLVPVTDDDSDFFSDAAFNTPREAEHFTLGNEPGRTVPGKIAGSTFAPITQHQATDRVRSETKSMLGDLAQDISRGGKFLLPIASQYMARTPVGAGVMGLTGASAIGLGNRGVSELRDEGYYGETLPNILASAAAIGASSAGNKYFSEGAVKDRQLSKQVESQLGYGTRHWPWQKSPLEPELLPEIKETLEGGNTYTLGDWRNAPLDRFYNKVGSRALPMRMDRSPLVFEPSKNPDPKTKVHTTGVKPASRSKGTPKWSAQQWDAVCRRFIQDAGLPASTDPNEVRAFLEEAYFRPESKYGRLFYTKGGVPAGFTTEEWAALRKKDTNPVAHELAASKGHVIDPALDAERAKALEERKNRFDRMSSKTNKAGIVTPQQYDKMGSIDFRLPFLKTANDAIRLPLRPAFRAGATVAPFVVQAALPYILKKVGGNSDE